VDLSVYGKANGKGGSGLRMIGSCKTDECPTCKSAPKTEKCAVCHGHRRVNDSDNSGAIGRPYMLLCVIEPETFSRDLGAEEAYTLDLHKLILDTKLRTSKTESTMENGFVLPPGAPVYLAPESSKKHRTASKGERAIDPTDPVHLELQKIIRESFGSLYAKVVVRRVTKGSKQYTINVTGTNCRYCQNIRREHHSQNIYFVVTKAEGVFQRCYDNGPKTDEMQHGACKDYAGGAIPLSTSSMNILWPETADALSVYTNALSCATSNAMKALLNAGEYLATKLYGTSWTATLGLKSSKSRRGLKDFMPQDPRDLGSRGIEAYKDLGLSWADALISLKCRSTTNLLEKPAQKSIQSIASLEKALWEAFDSVVLMAAMLPDPSVLEACQYLDEAYGSNAVFTDEMFQDGSEGPEGPQGPELEPNGLVYF